MILWIVSLNISISELKLLNDNIKSKNFFFKNFNLPRKVLRALLFPTNKY